MKPLHLALICNEYPPWPHGGTGTSNRDLATRLAARGHRVTIAGVYPRSTNAVEFPKRERDGGVDVLRFRYEGAFLRYRLGSLWNRLRLASALSRVHAEHPIDAVEASDYAGWLLFPTPRRVARIVRIRGSNLLFDSLLERPGNRWEHRLERRSLRSAGHLASVSAYAALHTSRVARLSPKTPCTVIHNAVDCTRFTPDIAAPPNPGEIVFANALAPKKGIVELIRAFGIVAKQHPLATLQLYGPFPGRANPELESARLLEMLAPEQRHRVRFHGRIPHDAVPAAFASAEICCLPSHVETFGIAALEGMASGKPVIFSRTGPGPELIEHEVSGLLCDPRDPEDIARLLLRCLSDPDLRTRLGANARKRALGEFEVEKWVDRNVAYYESCAGDPSLPKEGREV